MADLGQTFANHSQFWLNIGRNWRTLVELGQALTRLGEPRPTSAKRPRLAKLRRIRVISRPRKQWYSTCLPTSGMCGEHLFGNFRVIGQLSMRSAILGVSDFGPALTDFGRSLPDLANLGQSLADISSTTVIIDRLLANLDFRRDGSPAFGGHFRLNVRELRTSPGLPGVTFGDARRPSFR